MRGRNDIFYWQLLSTSTPFSSTEGLAKGTPFKDSGPCLPTSLSVVSDCRSPVPGVSEPGSPALCPVTAAAEPMVGWHLWLRPPWTTVLYQWNTQYGRNEFDSPNGDLQICSEVGNSRGRVQAPDCPLPALQKHS